MARCEDCVHSECCAGYEAGGIRSVLCGDKADTRCKRFKSNDDVVEIVRCKDCRQSEICPDTLLWCNQIATLVPPNGFCHCGERRASDES